MRKTVSCFCLALACVLAARTGADASVSPAAQEQQSEQHSTEPAGSDARSGKGLSLSDQVIQGILEPLRTGMVTQNIQMVLSIFDKKELDNYSDLQGQLRAFFQTYDEVRLRYQILQVTADQGTGSMTAMVEMDALPYGASQVPARRSAQMRFQIKLKGTAWKVTSFRPSDFFGLGYNRTDVQ
ncbi:MAG TPA: hypothetical protein VKB58_07705 [Terriglobales bacterium]|nr:hypothetical protein [Terriglobales bacterium]